jgi:hypothetical protein
VSILELAERTMPNDLLIFEVYDLQGLVNSGVLRPLGGQRYQFTRDHLHQPFLYPKPHLKPDWRVPLGDVWKANAGNVIQLLGPSGPAPTVQYAHQQGHTFQFELGTAYQNYYGSAVFTGDNAPVQAVVDAGPDRIVESGSWAQLVGNLTPPTRHQIMPFFWVQTAGPVVALNDTRVLDPQFLLPSVDVTTELTFMLVAQAGQQYTDSVTLTILPTASWDLLTGDGWDTLSGEEWDIMEP